MKTTMQKFKDELDNYLTLNLSSEAKTIIAIIAERAADKIIKEREQIEAAYDSAKNFPDADGSKYYFMKYITND